MGIESVLRVEGRAAGVADEAAVAHVHDVRDPDLAVVGLPVPLLGDPLLLGLRGAGCRRARGRAAGRLRRRVALRVVLLGIGLGVRLGAGIVGLRAAVLGRLGLVALVCLGGGSGLDLAARPNRSPFPRSVRSRRHARRRSSRRRRISHARPEPLTTSRWCRRRALRRASS